MNRDTTKQLDDLLSNPRAKLAQKALDYFDGNQEVQLIAVLDDEQKGRKRWREKGLIPRFRNITKMIVEKSGMLFNDSLPLFQVYDKDADVPNVESTDTLNKLIDQIEFHEFLVNLDAVVRLLKTGIVLVQWDNDSDKFILDILHRGNCEVIFNPITKAVVSMVYQTYQIGSTRGYRIFTTETITDLEDTNDQVSVVKVQPNIWNMVPCVAFYDTNTPRNGFWVEAQGDLINLNEMFNLHLTDSEFAASWSKLKTLFTNCKIDTGGVEQYEIQFAPGQALPHLAPGQASVLGGPNKIVFLNTNGVDSPFVEYKGPDIDVGPIDEMFNGWIRDFAADWGVRVKTAGEGAANSGFQLIVEEMDNLELRRKRQRMFEQGFKRLFRVMAGVVNKIHPGTFIEGSELFVSFNEPHLPVNPKEDEEVWSMRIKENRASRLDYFMVTKGMTKDQAQLKIIEIDQTIQPVVA